MERAKEEEKKTKIEKKIENKNEEEEGSSLYVWVDVRLGLGCWG